MADDGLLVYSGLNVLQSMGFSSVSGKQFSIQAISKAYFNATLECDESSEIINSIDLTCQPTGSTAYDQTRGCLYCQNLKESMVNARAQLEQESYTRSDGKIKQQTMSPDVARAWKQPDEEGYSIVFDVCRNICEACIIEGVDQRSRLHMTASCSQANPDFLARMKNDIEVSIRQKLNDHVQEFNKIDASLDFGAVSGSMSDTLMSVFQQDLATKMYEGVLAIQQLAMDDSESIVVSNVTQSFSADISESICDRASINVDFYSQDKVDAQETIIQNNSSGLNELRSAVEGSVDSLGSLWSLLEGKLIIIAVLIFTLLLTGLGAFLLVQ